MIPCLVILNADSYQLVYIDRSLSKKDDLRFATEDDLRRYVEDFKVKNKSLFIWFDYMIPSQVPFLV